MSPRPSQGRRPLFALRDARRMAYGNGGLWALGNGLVSTWLVIYWALDLAPAVAGLGVSLILAAPHLAGVLRLVAPALIERLGGRKTFCLGGFVLSAATLSFLPWLAAPGVLRSARASLAALVLLWCVYHLLQYLATVALWSWLAELAPGAIRGRFLGRRERWMVAGQAAAMLVTAAFTWGWRQLHPDQPRWIGYVIPAGLGIALMLGAVVPLARMPRPEAAAGRVGPRQTIRAILAPLTDGRFLGLVFFGCWFSFFNGITQSALHAYPARALGVTLATMLALQTGMRVGQFAISPWMGRLADRWGNRSVMAVSLFLVAQGPLCYYLASPGRPEWLAVAWAAWIAYAGLNVCLPNLMLRLSPGRADTPYIALYFAVTGLCYAASTVAGGALSDRYESAVFVLGGALRLDYYSAQFLFGWLARLAGVVVLLALVKEPRRAVHG